MTCAFMPDGARYNGRPHSVLPDDYLETLRVGDPIDDDSIGAARLA